MRLRPPAPRSRPCFPFTAAYWDLYQRIHRHRYNIAHRGRMAHRGLVSAGSGNGGRSRARTADLLLVRHYRPARHKWPIFRCLNPKELSADVLKFVEAY